MAPRTPAYADDDEVFSPSFASSGVDDSDLYSGMSSGGLASPSISLADLYGGAPAVPSLGGDFASLTDDDIAQLINQGAVTPQQKLATALIQLLPMGFAAIGGGGSDRFRAAAAGGLQAGQSAMKDFQTEAKNRQAMGIYGIRSKQALATAKNAAAEKEKQRQFQNTEKEEQRKFQEGMLDRREKFQMGMQAQNQAFQQRMVQLRESLEKKHGKEDDQPAAPEDVANFKTLFANIYGEEADKYKFPDVMTNDQLKQNVQTYIKEGRVTQNMREREGFSRDTAEGKEWFPLSNPKNDLKGQKIPSRAAAAADKAIEHGSNVMQMSNELATLYDPAKAPKRSFFGSSKEQNAWRQRSNQLFQGLVNEVKELQGMGANFTVTEQGIVKTQIGVVPPEVTTENMRKYFQKSVVEGADFSSAIKKFQDDMARTMFSTLDANGVGLNVPVLEQTETGRRFLGALGQTDIGRKQLGDYKRMTGTAAAPKQETFKQGDKTYRVVRDANGKAVGKVAL